MLRTDEDLIQAARNRKDAIGVSNVAIDEVAGLTLGHTDKAIGPARTRGLTMITYMNIIGALGCALVLVEDPERAHILSRYSKRNEKAVRLVSRYRRLMSELATKRWNAATPELRKATSLMLHEAKRQKASQNT